MFKKVVAWTFTSLKTVRKIDRAVWNGQEGIIFVSMEKIQVHTMLIMNSSTLRLKVERFPTRLALLVYREADDFFQRPSELCQHYSFRSKRIIRLGSCWWNEAIGSGGNYGRTESRLKESRYSKLLTLRTRRPKLTQNVMLIPIFASNAIAYVVARHSSLITLAVLFQASRSFTVATAQVLSFIIHLLSAFRDFWLEGVLIAIKSWFYRFLAEIVVLFLIVTLRAATVRMTIFPSSEAFAIKFQTFWFWTRAAFVRTAARVARRVVASTYQVILRRDWHRGR